MSCSFYGVKEHSTKGIITSLFLLCLWLGHQWGRMRKSTPQQMVHLTLWSAFATAVSTVGVLSTAALSQRFRPRFLPDLKAHFGDDLNFWDAFKLYDPYAYKLIVVSSFPTLKLVFLFVVILGLFAGRLLVPIYDSTRRYSSKAHPKHLLFIDATIGFLIIVIFPVLLSRAVSVYQTGLLAGSLQACVALFLSRFEETPRKQFWCAVGLFLLLISFFFVSPCIEKKISEVISPEIESSMVARHEPRLTPPPILGDIRERILAHVPLALVTGANRVAILGEASGSLVGELLKHSEILALTVVDDRRKYAADSTKDLRVKKVARNPLEWIRDEVAGHYSVIIHQFPRIIDDRCTEAYSVSYFESLRDLLTPGGILSISLDHYGGTAYWSVARTLAMAGFRYLLPIPHASSRGEGLDGIIIASREPFPLLRIILSPEANALLTSHALPPLEGLRQMADREFWHFASEAKHAVVLSKYTKTYLTIRREEQGGWLPLFLPAGG